MAADQPSDVVAQEREARSDERQSNDVITDLKAVTSQNLHQRLTWINSLVKHGVTIALLLTLTVLSPIYHLLLIHFAVDHQQQDAIEFHRTWFSTIAGIAGTAIGAYYMAARERRNE